MLEHINDLSDTSALRGQKPDPWCGQNSQCRAVLELWDKRMGTAAAAIVLAVAIVIAGLTMRAHRIEQLGQDPPSAALAHE